MEGALDAAGVLCLLGAPFAASSDGLGRQFATLLLVGTVMLLIPGSRYEDGSERWILVLVPFLVAGSLLLGLIAAWASSRRR